jgi:hypothetical protein
MSTTFTKLFSSITESTVWFESSDIRIVWITMLAMADRHGRIWASVPGLANRAKVPVETTREAIKRFLEPDPDSRTKTNDGRRIKEIDGGWALLNHGKYRAIRDTEERMAYKAQKERERRARIAAEKAPKSTSERGQERGQNGQTWTGVDTNGHNADADVKYLTTTYPAPSGHPSRASGGKPTSTPRLRIVRNVDPTLLDAVRELVKRFWRDMNPDSECPWTAKEEAALGKMLRDNPGVTEPTWFGMLRHRAMSVQAGECSASRLPHLWLKELRNFEDGPLTRFDKPLRQGRSDAALGMYKN